MKGRTHQLTHKRFDFLVPTPYSSCQGFANQFLDAVHSASIISVVSMHA